MKFLAKNSLYLALILGLHAPTQTFALPPAITSQPNNQTVECSQTAVLSVAATGSALTYQWKKGALNLSDGSNISGATASNLTLSGVTIAQTGGSYLVVVSGTGGSATSSTAILTVEDTTPPFVALVGSASLNVECHSTFTDPGITSSDTCAGDVSASTTTTGFVDVNTPGDYTLYYTVDDGNNFATVQRVFHVIDTRPPVIQVAGANSVFPMGTLAQGNDGSFYGTTISGGYYDQGWVYKMTPAGLITILHEFTGGADGGNPKAGLVKDASGDFFGTTFNGGGHSQGTVFKITPAGVLTTLYSFAAGNDGGHPQATLALGADGNFYGAAEYYGSGNAGTIFKITPAGALTPLYAFPGGTDGSEHAPLVLGSDGYFYGAISTAIFKMTPAGAVTTLKTFTGGEGPVAGLVQGTDGLFYGTTHHRGNYDFGIIFSMTTNGAMTTLYNFTGGADGGNPDAEMVQASDGTLYGTTDGENSSSTVFSITTNGVFNTLYHFSGGADGHNSQAGLAIGNDGKFYGTTTYGGADNGGTLFNITSAGSLTTLASFVGNARSTVECHGTFLDPGATASDACGGIFGVTASPAQSAFTRLVSFNGTSGSHPYANLTLGSDGNYYGSTSDGGTGTGNIFRLTPAGVFTSLFSFSGANGETPIGTMTAGPDGNLYGSTYNGSGTIYKVTPGGVVSTVLAAAGTGINGGLTLGQDGLLYGAASLGGTHGFGYIFSVSTNGVEVPLFSFSGPDGEYPLGTLALGNDTNFYGMANGGGTYNQGTIFKITPGGVFTTLHIFDGTNGANPQAGFVLGTDGNFYSTTLNGGSNDMGTVFKVTPAGILTRLVLFDGSNGSHPASGVVQGMDGNFYGTTSSGGAYGLGTVFKMTPAGALTTLYSFDGVNGATPYGGLVQFKEGVFYGTTYLGGDNDKGTVFKLEVGPNLNEPGDYLIHYTATDANGNSATNARVVHVQDTTAPAITFNTATDIIQWGDTNFGQNLIPVDLTNVLSVAAGELHGLALRSDGRVEAWGNDDSGQVDVPTGLSNVTAIVAGAFHSLALKSDGTVVAWGNNADGETNVPAGLSNVTAIASGYFHNLALKTDGTVVGWGSTTYNETTPPPQATNVIAVSAGYEYGIALRGDHTLVAWGYNVDGETNVPANATNITAISAGAQHILALKSDGTVIAWGDNSHGQTNVPPGLNNVVAISAGYFHNLALQANGHLVAWGDDSSGETDVPFGLISPSIISAGYNFNLAVRTLGGPSMTVECHAAFTDPGATASDACAGNFAATLTFPFGPLDVNSVGTYSVAYTATDSSGNNATTVYRQVTVVDTTPPVITMIGSNHIYTGYNLAFNDPGATATDACAGAAIVTTLGTVYTSIVGDYTLTYTSTDASGNSASVLRTVSVVNAAPPVITLQPFSQAVNAGGSVVFQTTATGFPLNYQWLFNGFPISDFAPFSGTGTDTLTITNLTLNLAGNYQLLVSNALAVATSSVAHLTVYGIAQSSGNHLNGYSSPRGTGISMVGHKLYVSGASGDLDGEGVLAQYTTPLGNEIQPDWTTNWPGLGGADEFNAILATSNHIYMAGDSFARTRDSYGAKENKGILVKYAASGPGSTAGGPSGELWDVQLPPSPGAFPFSGNESLNGLALAREATGTFLYATGLGQSSSANSGRLFLAKATTNGVPVWSRTDVTPGASSAPYSVGLGVATLGGNIYVAGRTEDSGTSKALIRKYDPQGNLVWSFAQSPGQYKAIVAYGGALYLMGSTALDSSADFLIERWDETGTRIWSRTYDMTGGEDVLNAGVFLNSYLYAVGSTASALGDAAPILLEIDPTAGDLLSTNTPGGGVHGIGGGGDIVSRGVATDGTDLYVVGDGGGLSINRFLVVRQSLDLSIVTASVPPALLNQPYQASVQVVGGVPPYFWSSIGLPPGLTLSSNGLISGIPTQNGVFGCQVQVTDSEDDGPVQQFNFDINVFDGSPTLVSLDQPLNGATTTAPGTFNLFASSSGENHASAISFYSSGNLLQTIAGASASYTVSNLSVGSYAFSASGVNVFGLVVPTAVAHVTVHDAGTALIDFETLDVAAGQTNGAALSSYLGGFGISASGITAGSDLAVFSAGGNNYLTQYGVNGAVSYTLHFAPSHSSVSWTRPQLIGPAFQPAWTAHAFNSSGVELGSVGEAQIYSAADVPAKTFTLSGPDVASIRFDADNRNFGGATSLSLDNLVLNDNTITAVAPTVSLTSPADGFNTPAPGSVILTAVADPGDGTLDHIDFYSGANLVGTTFSSPGSVNLNNLAPGNYTFHAVVVNSLGVSRSSTSVSITVSATTGINVINFDALDATTGNISGSSLSNYLAAFGVTLSGVTPGSPVQVVDGKNVLGGTAVTSSSPENFLTQTGGGNPVTFTLNFASALNSVAFTRIALHAGPSGASHPQWTARAFDASGVQVASVGESLITGAGDMAASSFQLTGANIRSVRIDSDSQHIAAFTGLLLDDLVLNTNVVVNPLSVAITSPGESGTFTAPANIQINVDANNTAGGIYQVVFYAGPNVLGTSTSSPYTFSWRDVLAGDYTLTAAVKDFSGAQLFSSPVHITVGSGTGNSSLVNFDSLSAFSGPVAGITLSNYLSTYGITVVSNSVTPGTTLAVKDQRTINNGAAVAAASPYNVLTQTGSNAPVSYTLSFKPPLSQFGFTRPKLLANPLAAHPAWTVTALDAVGVSLAQTNEALISSRAEVAAQTFMLNGPGISTIKFSSQGTALAAFDAMLLDDFILTTNAANIPPSVVMTNPAPNAVFIAPVIIPLAARAVDADGSISQVVFYVNGNLIAKDKTAPYSVKWTNTVPGNYSLTAVAWDKQGLIRTSPPVNITVNPSGFVLGIITQPADQTASAGSLVTFSVKVSGTNATTYEWLFNNVSLGPPSGNPNLTLAGVTTDNAGIYSVIVRSGLATVTSSGAVLTVLDPPVITAQPLSQNINAGNTLNLEVDASGSPDLTYQWWLNGARIIGATNNVFFIQNAQPFNSGNYFATVANSVGNAFSVVASVAVLPGGILPASADNFEDRISINPLLGAVTGNNEQATAQPGEPNHAGRPAAKSIWYTWHATFTGQLTLSTLGSSFDTVLAIYTGNVLTNLTLVTSDDDSGGFFAAQATFAVTEGTDYQIAVDGYRGASGNVILGLPAGQGYRVLPPAVAAALPVITAQPTNQVVQAGVDVTLTVTAASSTDLSYQWFFNDTPIAGANDSSLLLKHFSEDAIGRYDVLVANEAGSVHSASATIQIGVVNDSITANTSSEDKFGDAVDLADVLIAASKKQPHDSSGGDSRSYTVSQTFSTLGTTKEQGEPNHCGQPGGSSVWYTFTAPANGNLQVNTDGSSFNTILAVYTGPGTDFASLVEQGCGYTTNVAAQPQVTIPNVVSNTTFFIVVDGYQGANGGVHLHISLGQPPVIVSLPKDQPSGLGSTANFSVVSTGSTDLFYQWYFDSAPLAGATHSTLAVAGVQTNSQGLYSVVVSNAIGVITSAPPAFLTLQFDPLITVQPANVATNLGKPAKFSVTVAGQSPLHYQWYFDGVPINKATTSALSISSTKWTNNGTYSVVVTNLYGSTTSSNAVLFIGDVTPPTVSITAPANNSVATSTPLIVTGKATDNAGIAKVVFQLNGGTFATAAGSNLWTATVPVVPGTNVFAVRSIDLSSNQSTLVSRKFFYSYPTPLVVRTTGQGATKSTKGAINGALLQIGKTYSISAFVPPGVNAVFTNWTGGLDADGLTNISTLPNLNFLMSSNLVLQANFITNPFTAVSGSYNGLFNPIGGIQPSNSGLLTLTIAASSKGAFSGKVLMEGSSYSCSGTFNLSGNASCTVKRAGKSSLSLTLHLNLFPKDDRVTGSITSTNWFSAFTADRAVFNLTNNPATNFAGRYTIQLPLGSGAPAIAPGGYGVALVTNSLAGNIILSGSLGDGTVISQSVPVSKDGRMPFYNSLYTARGLLMGWLTFTNNPPKTVSGNLSWFKSPIPTDSFYPAGFTNVLSIAGSFLTPQPVNTRIMPFTNGTLTIADGDLGAPLVYNVTLLTNNTLTNLTGVPTNKFSAKFTNSTGGLIITFRPTGAGADKTAVGAVSQSQTNAAGWFQGTTHTGSILLSP